MNGLTSVGLLTAFGAGVVSFMSPCVLPLVPGYLSYVAGDALSARGETPARRAPLRLSLCFVLGFSTVFVTLGASATSLGHRDGGGHPDRKPDNFFVLASRHLPDSRKARMKGEHAASWFRTGREKEEG